MSKIGISHNSEMVDPINRVDTFINIHFTVTFLQWMIDRARHLIQRMVNNIISVSEKFNRNICKQYDSIVKKITEQSETTDQLVKQMKYVESLRAGELLQLKVRLD